MASIEILLGSELTHRAVEAFTFLPGLVAHKAPDAAGLDLYNVTHRMSGLAVLTHVPEAHIPALKRMLGDLCWTIPPEDIFDAPEYYSMIRVALQMVRGQDVLRQADDEDRRRCEPGGDWGFFPGVTTPLVHIEERLARLEVTVSHADLLGVAERASARGRVPALLLGIDDREELAIVPAVHFPRRFFSDLKVVMKDATIRGSITVGSDLTDKASRGHCWKVSFGRDLYMILGYLPFLRLVKRGLQ